MADDRELVRGLLSGEPAGLGDFYDAYADRLYDLARSMLGDADEAADVVHDTVLLVSQRIGQLREPDRFRPWVYAITRNQVRNRFRSRSRLVLDDEFAEQIAEEPDMSAEAEGNDLAELLSEAKAGLTEREREVLDLHARHGLEGEELADVLGVSTANAYKLVQRVRGRVSRSMGALMVARHGRRDCEDLQRLLEPWDGTFSPLWRKRVSRHVDGCDTCTRRRAALLGPGGLAGAAPFVVAPSLLRGRVLESARHLALADGTGTGESLPGEPVWSGDGFPIVEGLAGSGTSTGLSALTGSVAGKVAMAALAAALVVGALVTVDDGDEGPAPGEGLSSTTPPPTTTTTTTSEPPPTTTTTTEPPPTTTTTTEPPPTTTTTTEPPPTTTTTTTTEPPPPTTTTTTEPPPPTTTTTTEPPPTPTTTT
ncbi:MAG: sigma-70 family RNA polymerase sigma factor, partial [Acidimicrobiales bacterium]|nr:sigma-70 family RNA polymerase sigma factor [Acidimicrobiales bacterium]